MLVPPRRGSILFSGYPPFTASLTLAYRGGLNNSAPAALAPSDLRGNWAAKCDFRGWIIWSNPLKRSWCDENPRDAKGSLDFARDFACGAQTPAKRLNFDSAPIRQSSCWIAAALRSGRQRLGVFQGVRPEMTGGKGCLWSRQRVADFFVAAEGNWCKLVSYLIRACSATQKGHSRGRLCHTRIGKNNAPGLRPGVSILGLRPSAWSLSIG
jgi:hypothetical protein